MNDFGQMYRPFIDVKTQYGAVGDGTTDDTAAFQAALEGLSAGELLIPSGDYLISSALVVRDGVTLMGVGPRASSLLAGADDLTLVHHIGSNGGACRLRLSGNGRKRVSGLRVTPLDEQQAAVRVHQNYNHFRDLAIDGCEEGIVLQCGPCVGGAASGCWYNSFQSIHVYFCRRGIWLKDGPNAESSGTNRNQFFSVRVGQGTNTGLQIDSGGTNSFFGCSFEGVETLGGPSEIPTAIKIGSAGRFSGSNESNRFFGVQCEGCTRDIENANAYTELYGSYVRTGVYIAMPRIMLGGYEASIMPLVLPGLTFQTNSQFSGAENGAVMLPLGKLQFPVVSNPSSGSHTLDAYEEGVWKPTIAAGPMLGVSYRTQMGRFVKIGRHVLFWGHLKLDSLSGAAEEALRIEGLPYAAADMDAPASLRWDGLKPGRPDEIPCAFVREGETVIGIDVQTADGIGTASGMPATKLTPSTEFHFSGQYLTKD